MKYNTPHYRYLLFRRSKVLTAKLKRKNHNVKSKKKNTRKNHIKFRKVIEISYDQDCLFSILHQRKPILMTNCPPTAYSLPQHLHTIVSPMSTSKVRPLRIPYTEKQSQDHLFVDIPIKQFLQQKAYPLSVAQMQLNLEDVKLPSIVFKYFQGLKRGQNWINSVNLWYYKGQRVSTWHYDGHDNFIIQLEGQKTVYLHPPNQLGNGLTILKSLSAFSSDNNHAKQDQFQQFIKNSSQNVISICLKPQNMLFIPRGWWHYVHSVGEPCIAINVWGNSISTNIHQTEIQTLLKWAIFESSQRLAKSSIGGWQNLSEFQKQLQRKLIFMKYILQ